MLFVHLLNTFQTRVYCWATARQRNSCSVKCKLIDHFRKKAFHKGLLHGVWAQTHT